MESFGLKVILSILEFVKQNQESRFFNTVKYSKIISLFLLKMKTLIMVGIQLKKHPIW